MHSPNAWFQHSRGLNNQSGEGILISSISNYCSAFWLLPCLSAANDQAVNSLTTKYGYKAYLLFVPAENNRRPHGIDHVVKKVDDHPINIIRAAAGTPQ